MLNLKQINKIADVGIVLLGIMLAFEVLFYHSAITNWLASCVQAAGAWGWIVLCLFQFLQVVLIPIPSAFITLMSIKMYPNQIVLLYLLTLAVIVLGAVIAYLMGLRWGKKAVMWCAGSEDEYNKWLSALKSKKTNTIYLATVLLPIFPDDMLCLMAGSIKMNFWWYLFCNVLGRAIGLATFMFIFTTISNSLITIIVMILLMVLLCVFKIIIKRRLLRESCCDR